jgi:hypothetical protein
MSGDPDEVMAFQAVKPTKLDVTIPRTVARNTPTIARGRSCADLGSCTKVPQPRMDLVYGSAGPLEKLWKKAK